MGKFDHVAPVMKSLVGEPHFHGVAQRPGKPFAFWTTPSKNTKNREEKARGIGGLLDRSEATCPEGVSRREEPANQCKRAIFALPGNPVSVMACLARYVLPALRQMRNESWKPPARN